MDHTSMSGSLGPYISLTVPVLTFYHSVVTQSQLTVYPVP